MANLLLSVKEAQAQIVSAFQAVPQELAAVIEAGGRVLGEPVFAPGDLPAFDSSSMDGFAVRAEDAAGCTPEQPMTLEVIGDIPAGTFPDFTLQAGQAARIMTGAPLPRGADAVIPIEDTDAMNDPQIGGQNVAAPGWAGIFRPAQPGQNVRPRGQDIRRGEQLLSPGRMLRPQDIGLLVSVGRTSVAVYRRPRIALFSSGDELAQPGQPLKPGQIYDSNQYVLAGVLENAGAQVFRLGVVRDDPDQIYETLRRSLEYRVDLIVTSAGVSVGAFDYIRQVITAHGDLSFWRVNMRPGKPLAFGSFMGIPLIGLPGNPVSSYVGCQVFVLPALYRLAGREQSAPARRRAVLTHPIDSDGRESYLRAVVTEEQGRLAAALTGHQGSGNLLSLVQANALLIVPSGVKSLPSGSEVDIWLIDETSVSFL